MLKAQILSYDFFIASLIVLSVLLFTFSYFYYTSSEIRDTVKRNDMMEKLSLFSSIFSKTGSPVYWSPQEVVEIGLINDYEINETKLSSLSQIGYEKLVALIPTTPYNFYFEIRDESNQTLFNFGIFPAQAKNILLFERFRIFNQTFVKVKGFLWE